MATDFSSTATVEAVRPATTPPWPAYVAGACSLLAIVTVLIGRHDVLLAAAGYLLGALGTPAFTVVYRFMYRAARRNPFFISKPGMERLVLVILSVGIAAGVVNAWFIATELAKQ